jgi:hypothetical protein
MSNGGTVRAPWSIRCFVRGAAQLVPRRDRSKWCSDWLSHLESWWVLSERGEAAGSAASFCRLSFTSALDQRCTKLEFERMLRGPVFPLAGLALALVVLGAFTGGFSVTRALAEIALHPDPESMQMGRLIANLMPVTFAITAAGVLVFSARRSLRWNGWKHASFFFAKSALLSTVLTLLWFEVGARLRFPPAVGRPGARLLLFGIVLGLVYIVGFVYSFIWSLADQRSRCPTCLRRMAQPVSMGSWASVFEPPTTEFLCDEGHGALCLSEVDTSPPDRWIALDDSWSGLFETADKK